jgi:hypothetical protein
MPLIALSYEEIEGLHCLTSRWLIENQELTIGDATMRDCDMVASHYKFERELDKRNGK